MEMVFRQNRVDGWKILSERSTAWVVKLPDAQVVAFGPQCTHLGVPIIGTRIALVSMPCHTSIFAIDGR